MATNAEIIAVGSELLLGQILNTNARYLSMELAEVGIDTFRHTTVGDNKERIAAAVLHACAHSDIVIITGGLGPTPDDLTIEVLAQLFAVPMVYDKETFEHIAWLFRRAGKPMPESNSKQALRPAGSSILPNPDGTAPGIIWTVPRQLLKTAGIRHPRRTRLIIALPGVPREMTAMWKATARPYLEKTFASRVIWNCKLRFCGITESALAEKFADLLQGSNPTVAPFAGRWDCYLSVTASGRTAAEAQQLAAPVVAEIRARGELDLYGQDDDTLESVVGSLLASQDRTLAVAESVTGGLISHRLTSQPGAVAYLGLGITAYDNRSKSLLLSVSERLLDRYGAVSAECAQGMARGIRELAGATFGLAVTGIATAKGDTDDKQIGLVYIAVAVDGNVTVQKRTYPPVWPREEICFCSSNDALDMLRRRLLQ